MSSINMNLVVLAGNLTHDPELRHTNGGTAVTELRMAANRRFKKKDNTIGSDTVFVDVEVWGKQAESCCEWLKKGSPVLVEGRLKLDTWEKDGQRRSKLLVVGERVQFSVVREEQ